MREISRHIALARDGRSRASMNNPASFLDNHTARSRHSEAFWKAVIQHRRSLTFREHSRFHISRRGRGRACTYVRFWQYGWEDLRDGCAAFLVFRVGSARTLMRKEALPRVGARPRTPHRGGTHTMKVPPLSERPVTEEEEQDFLAPPSRRKKRSLAATRAALRPWAIGIGLTVLVAVAAVGAYSLGASIGSWNDRPSTAATPTVHPAPMPSASSEPPMSGGYAIGPDGVLVRPAEFAADTYTKPELPEEAKENTERGAELTAEYVIETLTYAWNTGDTQPFADITEAGAKFHDSTIDSINTFYANGWVYGNTSSVTSIVSVEPITDPKWNAQPDTIGVVFKVTTINGTACTGKQIIVSDSPFDIRFVLFMTWKDGHWVATEGSVSDYEEN